MKPTDMLDLKNGTRVLVRPMAYDNSLPFLATVRGIASNAVAVIGRSVIVEPDLQIGEFPMISVFEVHLSTTQL